MEVFSLSCAPYAVMTLRAGKPRPYLSLVTCSLFPFGFRHERSYVRSSASSPTAPNLSRAVERTSSRLKPTNAKRLLCQRQAPQIVRPT